MVFAGGAAHSSQAGLAHLGVLPRRWAVTDSGGSEELILQILAPAVELRRPVRLKYAKFPGEGTRICNPHIIHLSSTGKLLVDTFQTAGATEPGIPADALPLWRRCIIALITELKNAHRILRGGARIQPWQQLALCLDCLRRHGVTDRERVSVHAIA